ncbi:hypothetical protein GPK28_10630 [Ruminococcus bromii]|nr:hypothetical protein [Ruminococcus bromii]MBT9621390.1 hypothetical protein [Ruminococcus bromii]
MATITLYKEKVNGVGGLIDNLIKSSSNLDVQLGTLKNTFKVLIAVLAICRILLIVSVPRQKVKNQKSKI